VEELVKIATDFNSVAEAYGRIIISESYLPEALKTVKSSQSIGGLAGGTKYITQGIIFKFALDSKLGDNAWMYGGHSRNDEKAMKSACNEVKGLTEFMLADNCQSETLKNRC